MTPPLSTRLSEHAQGFFGASLSNTFSSKANGSTTLNEGFLGTLVTGVTLVAPEEVKFDSSTPPVPRNEYSASIAGSLFGTYSSPSTPSFILNGSLGYKRVFTDSLSLSVTFGGGAMWKNTFFLKSGNTKVKEKKPNPAYDIWKAKSEKFDAYNKQYAEKLAAFKAANEERVKNGLPPIPDEKFDSGLGKPPADPGKAPTDQITVTHLVKGKPVADEDRHQLDRGAWLFHGVALLIGIHDYVKVNIAAGMNAQLYPNHPEKPNELQNNGQTVEFALTPQLAVQLPGPLKGKVEFVGTIGYAANWHSNAPWSHHLIGGFGVQTPF